MHTHRICEVIRYVKRKRLLEMVISVTVYGSVSELWRNSCLDLLVQRKYIGKRFYIIRICSGDRLLISE